MLSIYRKGVTALGTAIFLLANAGTVTAASIGADATQPEIFEKIKSVLVTGFLYVLLPLLLIFILAKIIIAIVAKITGYTAGLGINLGTDNDELDDLFGIAGYTYDPKQDIFYSNTEPWQRKFGYCRLYDEALAPLSMIIDCEPIYFEYGGKRWMIEFWKGQYALNTGCEVGIYTEAFNLNIPGIFDGSFYNCARNEEQLHMAFCLKKNGEELFRRDDRHWWLTGFKLGEFSEPSELTMDIVIDFNNPIMCNAFIAGLLDAGYSKDSIMRIRNKVFFSFGKPHTKQPITRTAATDWIVQRKNELLCAEYRKATEAYDNLTDKFKAVKKMKPEVYDKVINIGKSKQVYESYDKIKDYLY